jgi:hypothetical protein
MPAEQPFFGQRLVVVLRGIEHHLDHTLGVSVGRSQGPGIHSKPPGDGGTHLFLIQDLPFDLAGFENVQRQRMQNGFRAERKPQGFHPAEQSALSVTQGGKSLPQGLITPAELGPICRLFSA